MIARLLVLGLVLLFVVTPAVAQESTLVGQGRKLFTDQGCYGCHTVSFGPEAYCPHAEDCHDGG